MYKWRLTTTKASGVSEGQTATEALTDTSTCSYLAHLLHHLSVTTGGAIHPSWSVCNWIFDLFHNLNRKQMKCQSSSLPFIPPSNNQSWAWKLCSIPGFSATRACMMCPAQSDVPRSRDVIRKHSDPGFLWPLTVSRGLHTASYSLYLPPFLLPISSRLSDWKVINDCSRQCSRQCEGWALITNFLYIDQRWNVSPEMHLMEFAPQGTSTFPMCFILLSQTILSTSNISVCTHFCNIFFCVFYRTLSSSAAVVKSWAFNKDSLLFLQTFRLSGFYFHMHPTRPTRSAWFDFPQATNRLRM